MAHTYEELKHKTVGQLRDIAKEIQDQNAVQGFTQMNKEHLLQAICTALHIEMHAHHEVMGLNKTQLREKMKELQDLLEKAENEGAKKSGASAKQQMEDAGLPDRLVQRLSYGL